MRVIKQRGRARPSFAWVSALFVAALICVPVTAFAGELSVYRLYNKWSGEHLYTTNLDEYRHLPTIGWRGEGEAWVSPTDGDPVYRLYNPYSGDHHYTKDLSEYERLQDLGWRGEGPIFCSLKDGGAPVYRLFNPWLTCGTHLFSTSRGEYDSLGIIGWQQEGAAFFAIRAGSGEGAIPETDPSPAGPNPGSGGSASPGTGPGEVDPNTYIVYVTAHGKRYHRQSCPATSGKRTRSMTLTDAVSKGYTPCKDCKPPSM